jgi:hypothetical protein
MGPAGKDGKNGLDGKAGPAGLAGAPGKDGKNGVDGKQGPVGPAGKDGRNGLDGKAGAVGPMGPAGKDGKNGVDGKQGPAGLAGKDGRNGVDGKSGLVGPVGPAGPPGPPGPAGVSHDLRASGARDITTLLKLPGDSRLDSAILRRVGRTVELSLEGLRGKSAINGILGRIPEGFRPAYHQSLVTSDTDFRMAKVDVAATNTAELSVRQPKGTDGLSPTATSLVWLTEDDWPAKFPGREIR